jgi:hypothetical protein
VKTAGFMIGLAIAAYGAYVTGGTRVTCSHAGSSGAECTVEMRRWLNRAVVEKGIVSGVHGARTSSASRTVTDNPTERPHLRRQREGREWQLVLTGHDGTSLERLDGGQESVTNGEIVFSTFARDPSAPAATVELAADGRVYIAVGIFMFLSTLAVPRREH